VVWQPTFLCLWVIDQRRDFGFWRAVSLWAAARCGFGGSSGCFWELGPAEHLMYHPATCHYHWTYLPSLSLRLPLACSSARMTRCNALFRVRSRGRASSLCLCSAWPVLSDRIHLSLSLPRVHSHIPRRTLGPPRSLAFTPRLRLRGRQAGESRLASSFHFSSHFLEIRSEPPPIFLLFSSARGRVSSDRSLEMGWDGIEIPPLRTRRARWLSIAWNSFFPCLLIASAFAQLQRGENTVHAVIAFLWWRTRGSGASGA
jgi:hypothetical protein